MACTNGHSSGLQTVHRLRLCTYGGLWPQYGPTGLYWATYVAIRFSVLNHKPPLKINIFILLFLKDVPIRHYVALWHIAVVHTALQALRTMAYGHRCAYTWAMPMLCHMACIRKHMDNLCVRPPVWPMWCHVCQGLTGHSTTHTTCVICLHLAYGQLVAYASLYRPTSWPF